MTYVSVVLIQFIVILCSARATGRLFLRFGQPRVVGEMVAGLLLGPSFLGLVAPHAFAAIFPPSSLDTLNALSRLGVWLFIFLVGAELDVGQLRKVGYAALITSNTSIVIPFLSGAGFARFLYPRFAGPRVSPLVFALFLGAAMSITAFPVLARILKERGIAGTKTGVLATACAAVDDVTAWCILAVMMVIAHPSGTQRPLWASFAMLLGYVGFMWGVLRPLLAWYCRRRQLSAMTSEYFALLLILLLVSCGMTQFIGVHGLFGAFVFGLVVPKYPGSVESILQRIEPLTATLLLPLFFVFSGLRTNIHALSGAGLWGYCAAVIGVAVMGKFAGAAIPARLFGNPWRTALSLGALMNTRGLMELVILNIGLELHVLTPELFSMMVIMAVVTTFMTSPILAAVSYQTLAVANRAAD